MGWTECDCSATLRAWADIPDLCPHRGTGHRGAGAGGRISGGSVPGAGHAAMEVLGEGGAETRDASTASRGLHSFRVQGVPENDAVKGRSCFFRVCTVCTCTTVIHRGGLTV